MRSSKPRSCGWSHGCRHCRMPNVTGGPLRAPRRRQLLRADGAREATAATANAAISTPRRCANCFELRPGAANRCRCPTPRRVGCLTRHRPRTGVNDPTAAHRHSRIVAGDRARPATSRRLSPRLDTPPNWSSSKPGRHVPRARSPRSASQSSPPRYASHCATTRSTSRCTRTKICRRHRNPTSSSPPSRRVKTLEMRWSAPEIGCSGNFRRCHRGDLAPRRRVAQLRALGLGLEIRPLRGNPDTRLGSLQR